jgi:cell division protein FtsI (penicillin-binding protein 3)
VSPAALRQLRIQLAGRRQAGLARARQRLSMGILLFGGLAAVATLRLGDLALAGDSGGSATSRAASLAPPRADIVDRSGADLATTFDAFALAVRPHALVGDPRRIAQRVAAALGRDDVARIYRELTHHGKYRYIQRRILPAEAKAVNAIGEPGLVLEREQERVYPNQFLGAHVIGYTDIDGRGQAGIERAFDERLSDPAERDAPLELAIDARVQHAMESELAAAMAKHSAIGAAGIVMDVHTGEVLALASLPELNPNKTGGVENDNARFNRATLGVYELGSTFKAMTMAMALDTGVVTSMEQGYDATRPLQMGRFRIRDDHPKARWLSIPEIFMYSSNIGTAQMARDIGTARQQHYIRRLGLMEPVHIELNERGRTLYPAQWGELATMTVSYGHGIAITPLHLASAYAALVNGGVWRPATLLKVQGGGVAKGRRVFSKEASRTMQAMLRLVVTHGTGKRAEAPGYRVGGKTGTAEKPDGGRYNRSALVTTFAGAFPMDDPKYVVVAMLDEPKGTSDTYGFRSAGWTTAPVVSKVVSRIAPVLGVAPSDVRDADIGPLLAHTQQGKAAG